MPGPYPPEFRRDVVASPGSTKPTLNQIAMDFGTSESCLANWLKKADVEEGVTEKVSAELREARKRIRLLEQLPGRQPKMRYCGSPKWLSTGFPSR